MLEISVDEQHDSKAHILRNTYNVERPKNEEDAVSYRLAS